MKDTKRNEKFLWLGNHPAIDFANTEIVESGQTVDLLEKPQDLVDWMQAATILTDRAWKDAHYFADSRLEEALKRAREYRLTLKNALEHLQQNGRLQKDGAAIRKTNRLLGQPRITFALSAAEQALQLKQDWAIAEPYDLLRPIAFSFAQLLTTQDLSRIRKCQNPDCVLFFLDISKSGTRSWCSMDICGNKHRVAAFRKRHGNDG
jgi:predicted RNA-binding Zn ribbon-like protein